MNADIVNIIIKSTDKPTGIATTDLPAKTGSADVLSHAVAGDERFNSFLAKRTSRRRSGRHDEIAEETGAQ